MQRQWKNNNWDDFFPIEMIFIEFRVLQESGIPGGK